MSKFEQFSKFYDLLVEANEFEKNLSFAGLQFIDESPLDALLSFFSEILFNEAGCDLFWEIIYSDHKTIMDKEDLWEALKDYVE